ncbi:glutathione S-transferase family protein [Mesobacterium pallidum]|uniref:glutathione S-transferase family protein n=1 Tax=Mesobacterium pallidum TaxID=2872037 RepID=UPI001EE28CDF|nr:glutathione S-transferase family protein [Mesobacterium pallidum]
MAHANQAFIAPLLDRFPGMQVGAGPNPGLHLFHAPNSICSQKVRAVLAQLGLDHWSHVLDIFQGETYDPVYVRSRVEGCAAAGLRLSHRHLGTTSVATSGCDACVVPTLIDSVSGDILVDSLRICLAIDGMAGATLVPDGIRDDILAELSMIDDLPNYQNLAVQVIPAGAPRNAFAASKVRRCTALIEEYGDDRALRAAYEAKRDKEQSAADQLFSEGEIAAARDAVARAFTALEVRLARQAGPWLFGDDVTMADLFWGAELIRSDDLDESGSWADGSLPAVAAYYDRLRGLPALQAAILNFPGARLTPKPATP